MDTLMGSSHHDEHGRPAYQASNLTGCHTAVLKFHRIYLIHWYHCVKVAGFHVMVTGRTGFTDLSSC